MEDIDPLADDDSDDGTYYPEGEVRKTSRMLTKQECGIIKIMTNRTNNLNQFRTSNLNQFRTSRLITTSRLNKISNNFPILLT